MKSIKENTTKYNFFSIIYIRKISEINVFVKKEYEFLLSSFPKNRNSKKVIFPFEKLIMK